MVERKNVQQAMQLLLVASLPTYNTANTTTKKQQKQVVWKPISQAATSPGVTTV